MWKSFYENAELLELPLLSMFLFAFTFASAAWLAWRKGDDVRAALPLERDDATRGDA
jgi:hypothetical protein